MAPGNREGALVGGRYRLERVLGVGGMASVWLARDERLGRPVAVKLLSENLLHDPSYVSRFRREAQVAAGLSHPNLVAVFDFGEDDGRPFLVMEHVDGETLAARIAAGSARELAPELLARGLLAALAHIHEAGIVHRDVKPGNVLISAGDRVRLTDFGIAQPQDATRLTTTGQVIGTRSYIAPEVMAGEAAGPRSDLFACGVVLAEAFGERLPAGVSAVAERLRATDPADRPGSAAAALVMLEGTDAAATVPLPESRPTTPMAATAPTAPLEARRRRTWLMVPLALAAAVAVAVALLLSGGEGDGDSPERGGGQATPAATSTVTVETTPEPTTREAKPPEKKKPKPAKDRAKGKAKGHDK